MPLTGMPSAVVPKRPLDGRTSGRHVIGTPKRSHSSADQARGPMAWVTRAAVPHDRGLTLVGDADRGHGSVEVATQLGHRDLHGVPDLRRVVLDPPRLREVLRELAVLPPAGCTRFVDRERAYACGARVNGDDDRASSHAGLRGYCALVSASASSPPPS